MKRPIARLFGRIVTIVICLILALAALAPEFSFAKTQKAKVVRVGWYDSAFNYKDQFGRRFGYAYDYQQKVAAYTGWKYKYVEGTWPELLKKLEAGEIDLMSDVSYTEERSETMRFSELPMGAEAYYAFISAESKGIDREDLTTLKGKRIGVYKDSMQEEFLRDWLKRQDLKAVIVPLTGSDESSQKMLKDGEIDVLIATDIYNDAEGFVPVAKIGAGDFYFAVSNERSDLMNELNVAMNRIQDENRYYNQELFDRYFGLTGANALLTTGEENWLKRHGVIRIGYRDNYLPFCTKDRGTGKLTGALKEYLAIASEGSGDVVPRFQSVAYPNTNEAFAALKKGEVDCVFPAAIGASDGEDMGIVMTRPLIQTEMYAVVKKSDHITVLPRKDFRVAVNTDNPNQRVFVENNFPEWEILPVKGERNSVKVVEDGMADAALVSRYRSLRREDLRNNALLETVVTGKSMPLAFAVRRSEGDLYAILGKATSRISSAAIETALVPYVHYEDKVSAKAFLRDHWIALLGIVSAVFLLILFLLYQRLEAQRSATERGELISATELDPLTKLYNRNFFFEYANRRFREEPDRPMDAVVVNIEQFHSVNALNGREFGDRVLWQLGNELRRCAEEADGIAGRFESDHFDLYCSHREDYQELFDHLQGTLDALSGNVSIRLRMGVMPWQKGLEPVQQFDQARTACNIARDNYQAPLIIFNEEIRQKEIHEQRLLSDLRRALEEKEFLVYFQPKYYIQCDPPKLSSAEALVRWRHPELGMIPPGDFIPLLERNAQIGKLDAYVWTETARQIALWKEKYGVEVPVSVNLSRLDVFDPELENTLDTLITENGLSRDVLKLEVTESAYTENADQVIQVIRRLRTKGYQIEMDDFGSGYSSLNMLSSMPVDVLKMDMAFVRNMEHSEKDIRLVELMLDIARNLRVPVIAEGVETEGQLRLLREMGCDVVQGFYFSPPLPAEEFEEKCVKGNCDGEIR